MEVVKIAEAEQTRQSVIATSARLRELTRQRLPKAINRFMAA
jgi:hypothetical protein